MSSVIEATGVTKRYGKVQALAGIDMKLEAGSVLALLGPNGAGKTTFVKAIATLIRPDGGTLLVSGIDVRREPQRVRAAIGLAGQFAAVEPVMTGRENLEMVGRLVGLGGREARITSSDLLERFDLTDAGDRPARTYSGGMRRRLDIAASLVGAPSLILLDEPTTGLDPVSRASVWESVRRIVAEGASVLLTTHYLDEADQLADAISIVDHGRVIAAGTPDELKSASGGDVIEVHLHSVEDIERTTRALSAVASGAPRMNTATRHISVPVREGKEGLRNIIRVLDDLGVEFDDIALRRPTLDEVFLSLTSAQVNEKEN